ncbi:MAG: hypothetical protein IJ995_00820 [Clostridia bacterium]|nr:hypothetical protein [Clostridia bacterium]
MSEFNTAVETASEQETVSQTISEERAAENEEMPKEERSKQAARRRALEQKAEELRSDARQEQLRQEVMNHPLVKEAMTLLEENRFKQDLDRVRAAYPSLTAQSPQEVGEIYCRLMASGQVDPVVAYEAQAAADRRREPIPENMVSAKSAGGAALYYSSQELDRLTEKDLRDPDVFRKAIASLSKLRS